MFTQVGAAAPGRITALAMHWIWQDGQRLTKEPLQIVDGKIAVPAQPGLDVESDTGALEAAHQLYLAKGLGVRNDAIARQYFLPGWKFDNKRPSFDR